MKHPKFATIEFSNIAKNTSEFNEFAWNKLTAGKLACLYRILAELDKDGQNSLIHDMRCDLRNFFHAFDQRTYNEYK